MEKQGENGNFTLAIQRFAPFTTEHRSYHFKETITRPSFIENNRIRRSKAISVRIPIVRRYVSLQRNDIEYSLTYYLTCRFLHIYLYLYHLHRELSSRFSLRDVRQNRRLINDIGLEREARLDKEDVGERDGRTAEGTNRLARPASKSSIRGRARRGEEIAFSRVGRCVVPRVKCETGIRERTSPRCARSERKEGKRKKGRRATKVK